MFDMVRLETRILSGEPAVNFGGEKAAPEVEAVLSSAGYLLHSALVVEVAEVVFGSLLFCSC